jgi:hypothetical protein
MKFTISVRSRTGPKAEGRSINHSSRASDI